MYKGTDALGTTWKLVKLLVTVTETLYAQLVNGTGLVSNLVHVRSRWERKRRQYTSFGTI